MPDTVTIHARPDRQFTLERFDDTESTDFLPDLAALTGVDLEPASDAAACGAAGCRETAQLIRGVIEGFGQRVLCADHMADLVRREVLDDE
ncbi:hypothetical protein [Halogeometricum borinquense]|uniref:hypothetical protein n=1 Tax=Halogeometricum borinquense TaxID=60847 RepID=UPI00343E0D9D